MIEKLIPNKILNSIINYDCIVIGGIITVEDEEGILFVKRSKNEFMANKWEIPSGNMEKGESMLQTISREIKEETSLDICKISKYESSVVYSTIDKHCLQLNFHIYCSGTVILSNEHSAYKFSDINSIKNHLDTFMLKVFNLI
ncbi:NUDIX domain-containing protein [Pantoea sp. Mhis]|uniref:NUDIX domain-containing protein n=1 Tax=Pantoea sp. Mhis TaxID=2576759 RepID=UPI001357F0DC|nr:NUDIX domain-containing protein [Pantoea sp. Mhis]MXP56790.1 NUDIX domain-containing protein [Pantoea sp. Mhis]